MPFRDDFVWGAAAASYQVEGAAREDGKGLSVWDQMCRERGRIWQGQTGDVACDHYHRHVEDVALMKQIGLKAYRLSVSWPRVIPEGTGKVNDKGLAFYDALVDELLAAGVRPWVTLFHWDYPYALYCRGGWLNRASADWFADYARVIVDKLSDRVSHWMTLNEPQCFIGLGHRTGEHAPGLKLDMCDVLLAAHNTLLAHGKGVQAIRAASKQPCQVGFAPTGGLRYPTSDSPADVEAARKETFTVRPDNVMGNAWWSDPIFLGHYPEQGLAVHGARMPAVADGDMETICQPLDFYGVNHYSGVPVRAGDDGQAVVVPFPEGHPQTAIRWWVTPEALYWLAKFLHERYGKPIVVTENGLSNEDWVSLDGEVHDPQRIDFTRRYLRQLKRAAEEGVDVRGYFHWSIMDNFEWAEGFKERFGMIYVDYLTGKRIPKDSARWYSKVIASNGENL
jgi:beta-glucosidase